jgi:hypothetical protein
VYSANGRKAAEAPTGRHLRGGRRGPRGTGGRRGCWRLAELRVSGQSRRAALLTAARPRRELSSERRTRAAGTPAPDRRRRGRQARFGLSPRSLPHAHREADPCRHLRRQVDGRPGRVDPRPTPSRTRRRRGRGREVVKPFSDEAKSAYKGNRRPGLEQARKLIEDLASQHGEAERRSGERPVVQVRLIRRAPWRAVPGGVLRPVELQTELQTNGA